MCQAQYEGIPSTNALCKPATESGASSHSPEGEGAEQLRDTEKSHTANGQAGDSDAGQCDPRQPDRAE